MDVLDEIRYLSEKGYKFMEVGNFIAAKTFFSNAASIAISHQELVLPPHDVKFKDLAQSLLQMAKDAHTLNFKQSNNTFVVPVNYSSIIPSNGGTPYVSRKRNKRSKTKTTKLSIEKSPIPENGSPKLQISDFENSTQLNDISVDDGKGVNLGYIVDSQNKIRWKPWKLMNGIVTITGGSGSGKTETLKLMVSELISQNVPCIIFDLHGDIELPIETISLDYLAKHSINPFELTSKSEIDGGPIPHINRLLNQFSYAIQDKLSSTQKSWLRCLLRFSYDYEGIYQNDPSSWDNEPPTFEFLLKLIKDSEFIIREFGNMEYIRIYENITNSTRMAVENRLSPILEHPAFSGNNNLSLEKLVTKPHRILLKPLNTIDMQFLAADTIMRQIFAYLKSMGHVTPGNDDDKFRLFIIIDEVKILTGFRGSLNDPYHILNRFATEARKFGLGLILASQVLGHFGRDIRSNSATKLILKTMDQDEARRCSKELKINLKELSTLSKPGEGFLITSSNKVATHIQIDQVKSSPDHMLALSEAVSQISNDGDIS